MFMNDIEKKYPPIVAVLLAIGCWVILGLIVWGFSPLF
ncbi:hypothetical protein [Caulobacter phage Cr30]|nr:hypothetical protein OZ74_gp101 [Caulobacter phage Cr30]AGS80986.1 hypothetical protein [Caulobacter phage Cr30]